MNDTQTAPSEATVHPLPRKANLRQDPAMLRYALEMSGYTQRELAEIVEVSESHMSGLLSGDRSCSKKVLDAIADATRCPVAGLYAHRERLDGAA